MASPYVSTTPSGYNSNPPPDDGSTSASNQLKWSTIKSKLSDPLNTFASAINAALVTAFGKAIGGAGVTSTGTDYSVQSSDQGKLVRATAAGITVTTPDATDVGSPFVFAVLNNSSGTITLDGYSSQTVDGNANVTVSSGTGMMLFTDGTNWFTTGLQGVLVGKQLMYGEIVNGTIAESNTSNAATFAIKTLAGTDPSSTDPVLICFRNATLATGNYVYRQITSATSLVISSGSTLGASNATAFRVWLVLFDDAATIRLGAINCLSGTNIYPLGQTPRASSTAEGGAGAADSAQVFYTGTAVSSKSYVIFGRATYESGLSTAGSWNASPTSLQLFGHGVPLPGSTVQVQQNVFSTMSTGTTVIPSDNTIPQITEGDQYATQAITPVSAANLFNICPSIVVANSGGVAVTAALFQDATANALSAVQIAPSATNANIASIDYWMLAATTSATTFRLRAGAAGSTTVVNGNSSGTQLFNGVMNSFMRVTEIVA